MSRSAESTQAAVLAVLKERGRLDAYGAAKRCDGLSVPEAGRALMALEEAGSARVVEDGGANGWASVFEHAES